MYTKVKTYIKQNQMIEMGDIVIAGVSGGADSMAMLYFLKKLREEMNFTLHVVHVHHGIRGIEANQDMDLVENVCADWKIPFRVFYYDVPSLSQKWKMGEEETGRLVRKEAFAKESSFLKQQQKEAGKDAKVKIAVAHNQNDLAETMLHHLARGTGLRGLCGIRPVSEDIIRPVLCLCRKDIEEIVKEKKISYITDSSNLEDHYTRNRIRHHVLPVLEEKVNPQAVGHMAEAARLLIQAEDYLCEKGKQTAEKFLLEKGTYFLTEDFMQEESVIKSYALREIFFAVTEQKRDFMQIHTEQVLGLFAGQVGKRIALPHGLLAKREYKGVLLKKEQIVSLSKNSNTEMDGLQKEWKVQEEGSMSCPLGIFQTRVFSWAQEKICEKKYTKWMDYDKIQGSLYVRTRKTGDYMVINQAGNRKKIQRCMIDEKIPAQEREKIPLLVLGSEVLWMIGGRINENYKVTSETKKILEIRYIQENDAK